MATDATGTPTALGIPKFNTSADAPSGLGGNAQMDSIDALLQANTGFQGSGIVIKGNKLVSTDANTAFSLFGNGTMKWGPGGATVLDTTLARTGASILTLTGSLTVSGTLNAQTGIQINGTAIPSSVFGRTGAVVATSGDYAVGQVTGAAPLASPALTGTPTAPTPATADNSTTLATTAYVKAQGYLSSAVASFNSRTGAVAPTSGDYTAAQVTNAADLSSASVQAFTGPVSYPSQRMKYISSSGSNPTVTPDLNTASYYKEAQISSGTITFANPLNPPGNGFAGMLIIDALNTSGGTPTVSWGAAYTAVGVGALALPASMSIGGRFTAVFVYNAVDALWRLIALN